MDLLSKTERKRLRSDKFRREMSSMVAILFSGVVLILVFLGAYSREIYNWLDSIHPVVAIFIIVPLLGLFGIMRLKKMLLK